MNSLSWFQNYRQKVLDHENACDDHNIDDQCIMCWYPPIPTVLMDLWFESIFPVVESYVAQNPKSTEPKLLRVVLPENLTKYKNEDIKYWLHQLTEEYVTHINDKLYESFLPTNDHGFVLNFDFDIQNQIYVYWIWEDLKTE